MKIAGKEIDLGLYVEEAKEKAIERIKSFNYLERCDSTDQIDLSFAFYQFEKEIWKKIVENFICTIEGSTPVETAIAEIRKRLDNDNIRYRKNSFKLILKNRKYKIAKYGLGFSCTICLPGENPRAPSIISGISAEMFSDLLFDFDTLIIPILEGYEAEIRSVIDKCIFEIIKERKIKLIQKQTIDNIISEFTESLGLKSEYWIEDDNVHLTLEQRKKGIFNFSIKELSEKLQDIQSIQDGLKTISPDDYHEKHCFFGRPNRALLY